MSKTKDALMRKQQKTQDEEIEEAIDEAMSAIEEQHMASTGVPRAKLIAYYQGIIERCRASIAAMHDDDEAEEDEAEENG